MMASFEFEGEQVRVVPPREMELGDLAFIKEHFYLDGLTALEGALEGQETDGWRALLIASVRRVVPDVPANHTGIDHVGIQALTEELNAETFAYLEAKAAETAAREGRTRPTKGTKRSSTRAGSGTSS